MTGLTLHKLQFAAATRDRQEFKCLEKWGPMQWGCALGGESGELQNKLKKLERDGSSAELLTEIADELGDVVAYAALVAECLGFDLSDSTRNKFNKVSDRLGSPIKL